MAVFTSCENDDTDFSHIIDGAEVEVKDIEFDSTPLVRVITVRSKFTATTK